MEQQPILLNKAKVVEITTLSATTIWRMMKKNEFPKNVRASMGRVAWYKSDVDKWIAERHKALSSTVGKNDGKINQR